MRRDASANYLKRLISRFALFPLPSLYHPEGLHVPAISGSVRLNRKQPGQSLSVLSSSQIKFHLETKSGESHVIARGWGHSIDIRNRRLPDRVYTACFLVDSNQIRCLAFQT
jgi:hypothetical protein